MKNFAIGFDSKHYLAHNNYGLLLASQERFDEAIAHYRLAIAVSPDYASAHHNLGDALRAQGKLDEAVSAYAEALRADPDFAQASENLDAARKELEGLREPGRDPEPGSGDAASEPEGFAR